jgi:serine/threonine protein phosphatase PrpC
MNCPKCGKPLRETARFCNVCGNPVVRSAVPSGARVAQTSTLLPDMPGVPAGAVNTAGSVPPTQPIFDDDGAPFAGALPPRSAPAAPGARPTTGAMVPTPASAPAAPDSIGALLMPDERAGGGTPGHPDDRLPWPLPASIIMDGRYRVEALLQSNDDGNLYRVSDLRGYEKCYVCGRVYGPSGASERYCVECGADMLARELLLRERRLDPGEEAPAGSGAEPPCQFAQGGRVYLVEPKVAQGQTYPRGARLVAGAATDVGRSRSGGHNEDSAVTLILDRFFDDSARPLGLFVLADGMGGHARGDRASRLVANNLTFAVLRQLAMPQLGTLTDTPLDEDTLASLLREAVKDANNALCSANQESDLDAGSTLVAALIAGETAHIANAGDSRCYAYDADAGLRRLTIDHSLVQQLVNGGLISPDDVYTHPERNKVIRSLGDDPDLPVDLFVQQLKPGMRLLLCCDGLWEMVRDPQIEQILREAPDAQAAADALITAANDGGGDDNVTVIVVEAR